MRTTSTRRETAAARRPARSSAWEPEQPGDGRAAIHALATCGRRLR
jgi:hypothetical protein